MYRIISALVAFGIVAKIAHRIHQKYKNRKDICEVLFTNPSSKCCSGLNDAKPCSNAYCIKRCTARIIHYIDLATEGICIAMNIFTYQPIFDALCQAQRRGVAVRVIFDNTMAKMTESKSKLLEENRMWFSAKKQKCGSTVYNYDDKLLSKLIWVFHFPFLKILKSDYSTTEMIAACTTNFA